MASEPQPQQPKGLNELRKKPNPDLEAIPGGDEGDGQPQGNLQSAPSPSLPSRKGVDVGGIPREKPTEAPGPQSPAIPGGGQLASAPTPETHPDSASASTPTDTPPSPPARPKDAPPVDTDAVGEPLAEDLTDDDDQDDNRPDPRDFRNDKEEPDEAEPEGEEPSSGSESPKQPGEESDEAEADETAETGAGEEGIAEGGGAEAGGAEAGAGAAEGAAAGAEVAEGAEAAGAAVATSEVWAPVALVILVVILCIIGFVVLTGMVGAATNGGTGKSGSPDQQIPTGNISQTGQALIDAFMQQKNISYQNLGAEEDIRAGDVSSHTLQAVLWVAQQPGIGNLAISAAACRSHDAGTLHCPSSGPPGSAIDIGSSGTTNPGQINKLLCQSALEGGNPYHINELFGITPSCILKGGKRSSSNPDPPNHVHVSTDGGV